VTSIHTALDGLARIMHENGLAAGDIARIDAGLSQATYLHCAWEYKAQGVTAAQMNLYFGLAMIVLDGAAFVDQYREERLRDPRALDLIGRMTARVDPGIEAMGAAFRHAARITVETKDGRTFRREVLHRRGSAEDPLKPEDIVAKFRQVVRACLAPRDIDRVIALVDGIERQDSLDELIRICAAPRAQ
jgi:2-methylcitrate dehydratase PrpD